MMTLNSITIAILSLSAWNAKGVFGSAIESYFGFSPDFTAYKFDVTILDNTTDDTIIAADYFHLGGGIDYHFHDFFAKILISSIKR